MTGFRSASTAQGIGFNAGTNIATQSSIVVPLPVGVQAGDILIAAFTVNPFASDNAITGGTKMVPVGSTWTVITNSIGSGQIRALLKVATASEPSTYTFEVRNSTNNTLSNSYINAILGAWEGFGPPVVVTLSNSSRFHQEQAIDTAPFPESEVIDIDSVTMHGTETTTGGFAVYLWEGWEGIENFDGTFSDHGYPPYPANIPWVDIDELSPLVAHEFLHYEYLAGSADRGLNPFGVSYRTINDSFELGSQIIPAGALPDGTANYSWQHAGLEAGFGETVFVYRMLIEAASDTPYWGINAFPL